MRINNEKKIGLIVQARMGSRRLPGKSNIEVAGQTVLKWVFSICKSVKNIDNIILATSSSHDCDCLEKLAIQEGLGCVRGSETDVLSRFIKIIKTYNFDHIIRITGDDLCHDPHLIDYGLSVYLNENCEYLISSDMKKPLIDGLIFEVININLLLEIYNKELVLKEDKEHVTYSIRKQIISYKQGFLDYNQIPNIYFNNSPIKLCIDTKEDLYSIRNAWAEKTSENGIKIPDTTKIIKNLINSKK